MKFKTENYKIIAKTLFGLEEILAAEIKELGGENIEILKRAVSFTGNDKLLYETNLWLRTALRILVPIHMFRVKDEKELYLRTKEYKWNEIISPDNTIAVDSTVSSDNFNHSKFAALKVKDAIVDKIRNKFGKRPNVDTQNPDYRINLHIFNEDATISLDSSGDSLHKRGYRLAQIDAPLNEVLAAGMIKLAGWNANNDFYDPMCGSGTLLMEAAAIAANIPPGLMRKFGLMNWSDFNNELWQSILQNVKPVKPTIDIYGMDNSAKAFVISRKNILNAGFEDYIHLKKDNFFNLKPKSDEGTLIFNPPYDERMKQDEIIDFYQKIGDKLKHDLKGFDAWIISGNLSAFKHLGLKPSARIPLYNGKIECRYNHFGLY